MTPCRIHEWDEELQSSRSRGAYSPDLGAGGTSSVQAARPGGEGQPASACFTALRPSRLASSSASQVAVLSAVGYTVGSLKVCLLSLICLICFSTATIA